ncbi:MAG: SCO1664 family protein, partial [Brachybacterium tyrofermentans]
QRLTDLLSTDEISSLTARCTQLRASGRFPAPSGEMPAVPWPLF